jgi:hypothetical protein
MELSNSMVFGISNVKPLGSAIREIISKEDLTEPGWEWRVDGKGLELCPVAGFCISTVVPSGSANKELVN